MTRSSIDIRAYVYAFVTLVLTFGGFLFLWYRLKPPFLRTETYAILASLIVVGLFTVIVFQSARLSRTASLMAQGMAESMLSYSKELFTELYRGSPVPYILIGKNGTIDSANLAAIRLFGVEEGWLQGKIIFDLLQEENEEGNKLALIPEYFRERVPINDEDLMIVRRDGSTRWVLLSLFSFTDSNRHHKGLLTLVDVTKQKEVDKAKTEFVSLASHQLRTPISSMRWNVELLEASGAERFTPGEQDYIEKVKRGIERMDILVSDFLSVSKLELGTFVPNMETLLFNEFMTSIIEAHENKAAARGIRIERYWSEGDSIVADSHLLEMAISNLVSNAVKYSVDGGVVTITFEQHPGNYVIAVSDTGIGIPEDDQDKIFSKVFRAANAREEVPDGTGLGLYIVREALRVMGGDVTFVSALGRGTTFTVVLPTS